MYYSIDNENQVLQDKFIFLVLIPYLVLDIQYLPFFSFRFPFNVNRVIGPLISHHGKIVHLMIRLVQTCKFIFLLVPFGCADLASFEFWFLPL